MSSLGVEPALNARAVERRSQGEFSILLFILCYASLQVPGYFVHWKCCIQVTCCLGMSCDALAFCKALLADHGGFAPSWRKF